MLSLALAYGGTVFASHSFEAGVQGSNIPVNTHIRLDGITLEPSGVLPLYDASPNFVSGHFLLTDECVPVDDDTYQPRVAIIAGHVDELNSRTFLSSIPLFYISSVSNLNGNNICVWHAHIPDPLNGGPPRITDIDMVNLSSESVTFSGGHIADINIQRVLGSIASVPYSGGPDISGVGPNPIFDLNDDEHENDGMGHTG